MEDVSKRRFLRIAGLSVAGGLASRLAGAEPARRPQRVIIVTFGGGVRYAETFAPEGVRNIPRLEQMRPKGFFYRSCTNSGVLSHFNSTASIISGNWQRVDDFGFEPPAGPTLFECLQKQTHTGPADAWVVATNKSFAQIAPQGANVVLPKQLLLDAVRGVVTKRTGEGVADRQIVQRQLENILAEGYEGVGWTIFKAGRQLDQHMRDTLTHALVDYINGPEAPASGDELTYFITREVMREFAPRLILVNFWDMDVAHWGSYSLYLQAITRTDRLTGMLWEEICGNPRYKDQTTMLVLPELGRDGDQNTANGFLNHRSGDPSCRQTWLLAMGMGAHPGESSRPVGHVDVMATAAELLGIKTGEISGKPLEEIL